MKRQNKKTKKRNFEKFTKRENTKRKNAKATLRRMVESLGYDAHGVRIIDKEERAYHRAQSGASHATHIRQGEFSLSKNGYGFVRVEGEERDIFVASGKTLGALTGDIVEVHYRAYTVDGVEKTEGRITKIMQYGVTSFAGTLVRNRGRSHESAYLAIADDPRISVEVPIHNRGGAKVGDKVFVRLHRGERMYGEVVASFGDANSKEANYAAILAEEGIAEEFSEEALALAEVQASRPIADLDAGARRNLSHLTVFTIDSEYAKDLDDAISLVRTRDGGYKLGVHIADVSAYIPEKSALEREAFARGTSVYFTDRVVPMLPKVLSNGACSLNAGEEKATLSCFITLSASGEIVGSSIEMTTIVSKKRGVYSQINDILENGKKSSYYKEYEKIYPTLQKMHELYLILLARAKMRGSVELESTENQILLDENGAPVDILPVVRGDSERMIEQFMLLANEAVATTLREREIPCVYRIHENPPPAKLSEFLIFMQNLGYNITHIDPENPSGADLNRLLVSASERGMGECVSYLLLRSMAKAKYSEVHHSHYGLAIENYCHFTSPIRRLADLATHRIIHRVLLGGEPAKKYASYARRAAAAATDSELRAVSAERRIEHLYEAIYMSRFIGKHFPARIVSVQSFGMFCALENGVEGLLPVSDLIGMPIFDEKNLTLRTHARTFRIGEPIEVEVVECDIVHGKIRFALW
ncbi:MAG: VacB/RNase II family 3'-5' exoribonuclease [Clostridia bacterium]|nr:VacB/RNase II family 3'-5' exoribonuclease [Clostridia bacterium]